MQPALEQARLSLSSVRHDGGLAATIYKGSINLIHIAFHCGSVGNLQMLPIGLLIGYPTNENLFRLAGKPRNLPLGMLTVRD
jgi:hypothetical protein